MTLYCSTRSKIRLEKITDRTTYLLIDLSLHDIVHSLRAVLIFLDQQWEALHELNQGVEFVGICHLLLEAFLLSLCFDTLANLCDEFFHLTHVLENAFGYIFESIHRNLAQSTLLFGDKASLELRDQAKVNIKLVKQAHKLYQSLILLLISSHQVLDVLVDACLASLTLWALCKGHIFDAYS